MARRAVFLPRKVDARICFPTLSHENTMTTPFVRRAALTLAAVTLAGCSESPTLPSADLNLGYEQVSFNVPQGWGYGGLPASTFEIEADEEVVHGGRFSMKIENLGTGNYGSTLRLIQPEHVRGKTVRVSGWIRTADVNATAYAASPFAGLWMRVDTPEGNATGGFDNMSDRGPSGTTGWQRFELEIDVPQNATAVTIGTILVGGGRAWFDDLEITVNGRRYGAG